MVVLFLFFYIISSCCSYNSSVYLRIIISSLSNLLIFINLKMNTSVPKNSWVVDSTNKLGNRPDGEPWNDTFPSIIDFNEDACLERILNEGGSEEDGLAMWARN